MPTPKSDYWQQREQAEKDWIEANLKDDAQFNQLMQRHYQEMLVEIQRDIDSEYQKYAGYSGSTMKQAIRKVADEDVKAYQAKAAKIVAEAQQLRKEKGRPLQASDFTKEVNDQLKLYNATMRINRLEMLKSKIGLELTEGHMKIDADLSQRLADGYQNEIKRQAGILGETIPMTRVGETIATVNAQTEGATFSQRLWANQAALKAQLDTLLTQAMIRGESPLVLARKLKAQINDTVTNRRYVSERLARTEMARVQDKAQMNSFDKYGYDYCKWIAEPSACRICRDIASVNDGIYKVDDVPDIPVHANCRCSKAAGYKENQESPIQGISMEDYNDLTADFIKAGGIISTGEDVDRHLKYQDAEGSTFDDKTILLRSDASRAALIEEVYHANQHATGVLKSNPSQEDYFNAEIEAQHYLLDNAKSLKLTQQEIEQTKINLKYWEDSLHGL